MCFSYIAVFSFFIDEIECKIDADKAKIDYIKRKDVVQISAHQLAANARKVAENDRACEDDAFSLCGTGRIAFPNGNGPRNAEANQHNAFKNTYHDKFSLEIDFIFDTIIHLTIQFVKYIIVIKSKTSRYELEALWI